MKINYKNLITIIYTVVLFLDRLDLTIVNVTLPTVADYFKISITATDWITISFLLALAISIPISSWLADRFGSKRIYLLAMFLFGMGSSLCFWTPNLEFLILLRFMQGLGGGMLIPVGMTMLYREYDKSEYASITSFTFLPSLLAPAIAPFLGGIILDYFGWRPVFLFSGPISLIIFIIATFYLKDDKQYNHKMPFDWMGYILSSTLLIDLFILLSKLGKKGGDINLMLEVVLFITLFLIFIRWEKRATFPLIKLDFFKHKLFVKANLIQLCFQACHFGAIFLIGMYLQVGVGMVASAAGLIMGMQALGAMVTSRYSVRLYNKYGPRVPICIGLMGIAVLSPCTLLITQPNMVIAGIILFFFRGIFSGLCGTPIQTLSIIEFSKTEIGQVNSIFNICRQIAISLGVAISSLLIAMGLNLTKHKELTGILNSYYVFGWGFLAIMLLAIVGFFIAWTIKEKIVMPK